MNTAAELLGPWAISGPSRVVASALLQVHAGQRVQRERLLVDGERLAALLSAQGFAPAGGCALFQFCCTPQANALHEFLAAKGILTHQAPGRSGRAASGYAEVA